MDSNRRLQLKDIRIASPCPASWDAMYGDQQVRYCNVCSKSVYNLSAMTKAEAELLINRMQGGFCARIYLRKDGTVMTADCPVGLARLRRLIVKRVAATAAVAFSLCAGIVTFIADRVLSTAIAKAVSSVALTSAVVTSLSAVEPPVAQSTMGLVRPPTPREGIPDGPVVVAGDITPPVLIFKKIPAYPSLLVGIQGLTILEAIIDRTGAVQNIRILRSVHPVLDRNAVEAVGQWRYKPALRNGKPISVYFTITVLHHVR